MKAELVCAPVMADSLKDLRGVETCPETGWESDAVVSNDKEWNWLPVIT